MWRRQALRSVGVVVNLIRILLAAYLVAEVDEALETRRLREQPLDVGRGLHRRIDTGVVHQMHPGWHVDHIPITTDRTCSNSTPPTSLTTPDIVHHVCSANRPRYAR